MIIQVDKSGSIDGFNNVLDSIVKENEVKSLLILACEDNDLPMDAVNDKLKSLPLPVFGGLFPAIIYGKSKLEKGMVVAGFSHDANVHVIPRLSDENMDYEQVIDEKIPNVGDASTMFVFVDGYARRITALIDSLFNIFGLEVNYIGGGAGSMGMEQKPCLFSNYGLVQDSAILALMNLRSGVGVSHGWSEISGPYRITESEHDIIRTLDWQPALHVYKTVVENHAQKMLGEDNFFDVAKGYPFGINKLEAEKIVRIPLKIVDHDCLKCIGEVPEGSFVHILSGDAKSLVQAAANALQLAESVYGEIRENDAILFMDCISRVLYLDSFFSKELEAVSRKSVPLIGALTIGEIANSGKDYLEFYNKSCVVGVVEG